MTSARSLVCSSQQQWLRSVSNSSHGSSSDESKINTGILHFGIGRFFRAHGAVYIQTLLNAGKEKNNGWGICGVCILPSDRFIYDSLKAQGCKYTLMERDAKGEAVKTIDSIKKVLHGHQDPAAVFDAMLNKDVKLITCTVTEAGYYFGASKSLDMSDPLIQHDLEYPSTPKTIYGYLAHGLHLRHQQNLPPITVQSCDNIQGNGDLFQKLMLEFCGKVYPSLVPVIEAGEKVSFPNSMVDRITPAASPEELVYVKEKLRVEDDAVPVTAESYTQWVVEDKYCGERPPWEEIGVQVRDVM